MRLRKSLAQSFQSYTGSYLWIVGYISVVIITEEIVVTDRFICDERSCCDKSAYKYCDMFLAVFKIHYDTTQI